MVTDLLPIKETWDTIDFFLFKYKILAGGDFLYIEDLNHLVGKKYFKILFGALSP